MNIAVIGANGRSGKAFVERALQAGHSVRAGVYQTNTLVNHPNLTVVQCDATDQNAVTHLIQGCDAVVSLIGHVKGSPARVQTDAIKVVIDAMKHSGIKRIISLTGTGVRFAGDKITLVDRFLNLGVSIVDPQRVADGRAHAEVLKTSDLDWTIIRVLKLQNVAPHPFTLKAHGPTKWFVGREEVAQAILQVLEEKSFVGEAPIIGRADRLNHR